VWSAQRVPTAINLGFLDRIGHAILNKSMGVAFDFTQLPLSWERVKGKTSPLGKLSCLYLE
jgi:hypothetical protein